MLSANLHAQSHWFDRYNDAAQLDQPHWATPLVTSNARIEQGLRTDFVRQPGADTVWNFGNSKGLQLVPLPRTELRISPPPFITHSKAGATDGFGDLAFRIKYRLYGSNEQQHNAIVTAVLSASVPTGKNGNGSCCAVLTPSFEFGKGFGKLALTTAVAGALSVSGTSRLGRPVSLNNAIQYHATKYLWLQDEFNTTIYNGGKNGGKLQTFNTPGIVVSRIPITRSERSEAAPLLVTLGAGEQIALTSFHSYDHAPIFSARLRF